MAAGDVEVNVTTNNSRKGASFDGVDDKISLVSPISQLSKDKNFSISVDFMKTKGDGSLIAALINSIISASDRFSFGILNANEHIVVGIYDGADYTYKKSSSAAINLSVWNNAIATFDTSTIKLYLNGVEQTNTGEQPASGAVVGAAFGSDASDTTKSWGGSISNIKIWDRALSETEVTKVTAGQDITDGLVHRWKLYDDYKDSVGTADGTNTGSILTITDDAIAAAIKADRTTANDKYLMVGMPGGQVVSAVIEEAP